MISKEESYKRIEQLVKRFEEQLNSYKSIQYNETLTRRDFIDPFFTALGWDVDNSQGFAEAYREVIHEDKVRIGDATKAPDYSFKLPGGKRLFFVEAKKPSVEIKDDISVAYQIRRYGWSAKLPISIITDFEEFAVYDCTRKPKSTDKASVARIKYIHFKDYLKEFEYLWDTFSKESILKGGLDKYIINDRAKKGTTSVDQDFLDTLNKWRKILATNIGQRNKNLDEDELNYAVQTILDRLIFLRIAEDRLVEPYGQLRTATSHKGDLYASVFYLFQSADQKYNSGLFDFSKDSITNKIKIDNKVIKSIINEMYYPESPYEFSVIPIEILGNVYEQFLGKQIKIDDNHKLRINEKPEVRKSGGVYYTPQNIVDYIVENTIGKIIDGKTPQEISNIKILDPACGSGSFLIGAYQYLLNYHKNYYNEKNTKTGKKESPILPNGNLTINEKKRILVNNIYGVDIDTNAVEVTKLSLLLKCLEGENDTTIEQQQKLWHERVLPSLDNNIKCGNSLIDTDIYENEIEYYIEKKIKPFNWQKAFPEVFKPKREKNKMKDISELATKAKHHATKALEYVSQLTEKIAVVSDTQEEYNQGGFDVIIGNPPYVQTTSKITLEQEYLKSHYVASNDLYTMFVEKSLNLLKNGGRFGFIVPSLFIKGVKYNNFRSIINSKTNDFYFYEKGDKIFQNVKMPTTIITGTKGIRLIAYDYFQNNNIKFFNKVEIIKLKDISTIRRGIEVGRSILNTSGNIKCLTGSNIDRYLIKSYYFLDDKSLELHKKSSYIFKSPKIIVRETGSYFFATLEFENTYTTRSLYNIQLKYNKLSYWVLGIINSKLMRFYFNNFISSDTNIFPKLRIAQLKELPIPEHIDKSLQERISKLVEQLLTLNKELVNASIPTKIEQIRTKIDYCENKIDELVYQIYGISKEEIEFIENDLKAKQ